MTSTTLLLSALACAALAGCAGGSGGSADAPEWSLSGVISAVEPGAEATRVTVRPDAGGDPFVLVVCPQTRIEVQRPGGAVDAGAASDLAVGARVGAEHDGAQMRSLPPQYNATRVRVTPAP